MSEVTPEYAVRDLLPSIVDSVDPVVILPHLRCIAPARQETIRSEQRNEGRRIAAQSLVMYMTGRDDWFPQFCAALKHPEVECVRLAEKLEAMVRTEPVRVRDCKDVKEKSIHKGTPIRDLKAPIKRAFRKLQYNTLENWQTFADKAGYTVDQISHFESTQNPAITLFVNWVTTKDATIGRLVEILCEMKREDILEEFKKTEARKVIEEIEAQLLKDGHGSKVVTSLNKARKESKRCLKPSPSRNTPREEKSKGAVRNTHSDDPKMQMIHAEGSFRESTRAHRTPISGKTQLTDSGEGEIMSGLHLPQNKLIPGASTAERHTVPHSRNTGNQFFYESTRSDTELSDKGAGVEGPEFHNLNEMEMLHMQGDEEVKARSDTQRAQLNSSFFKKKRQIISKIENELEVMDMPTAVSRLVQPVIQTKQECKVNEAQRDQQLATQGFVDNRREVENFGTKKPLVESALGTPRGDTMGHPGRLKSVARQPTGEIELFISNDSTELNSAAQIQCPYLNTFLKDKHPSLIEVENKQNTISLPEAVAPENCESSIKKTSLASATDGSAVPANTPSSPHGKGEVVLISIDNSVSKYHAIKYDIRAAATQSKKHFTVHCESEGDAKCTPTADVNQRLLTIQDTELSVNDHTSNLDKSRITPINKEFVQSDILQCCYNCKAVFLKGRAEPLHFKSTEYSSDITVHSHTIIKLCETGKAGGDYAADRDMYTSTNLPGGSRSMLQNYGQRSSLNYSSSLPLFQPGSSVMENGYHKDMLAQGQCHNTKPDWSTLMKIPSVLSGVCRKFTGNYSVTTRSVVAVGKVARYCNKILQYY